MSNNSLFFFTYHRGKDYRQLNLEGFEYPLSFFQKLVEKYGFQIEDYTEEYSHPRNQNMLKIFKK